MPPARWTARCSQRADRLFRTALCFLISLSPLMAEAPASAVAGFEAYCRSFEAAPRATVTAAIEKVRTPAIPGALLHHWRATAFVPGAKAADFERLLKDFTGYPKYFAPQVLKATPDASGVTLRVRQKHIITVVLDSTYEVSFGPGFSTSRSTRVEEIEPGGDHGFLWRLNSYWTWTERDAGLDLRLEAISLTRDVPALLGWAVRPFIQSIPRESLQFTLDSARKALAQPRV